MYKIATVMSDVRGRTLKGSVSVLLDLYITSLPDTVLSYNDVTWCDYDSVFNAIGSHIVDTGIALELCTVV